MLISGGKYVHIPEAQATRDCDYFQLFNEFQFEFKHTCIVNVLKLRKKQKNINNVN